MDREEKYILENFGRRTPFKVPEGYFDGVASQIMDNLPSKDDARVAQVVQMMPRKPRLVRRIAIAAAGVCIVVVSLGGFFLKESNQAQRSPSHAVAPTPASGSYSAVDQLADYAMLDTDDLYSYMQDPE